MDLSKLYRTLIIEASQDPTYRREVSHATQTSEMFNPSCGDELTLSVRIEDGVIVDVGFQGTGCAISMAGAHMMCDLLVGKTLAEAEQLHHQFQLLMAGKLAKSEQENLREAAVLEGVSRFPMRIRCATLAWDALEKINERQEKKEAESIE